MVSIFLASSLFSLLTFFSLLSPSTTLTSLRIAPTFAHIVANLLKALHSRPRSSSSASTSSPLQASIACSQHPGSHESQVVWMDWILWWRKHTGGKCRIQWSKTVRDGLYRSRWDLALGLQGLLRQGPMAGGHDLEETSFSHQGAGGQTVYGASVLSWAYLGDLKFFASLSLLAQIIPLHTS